MLLAAYMYINFLLFCCMNKVAMALETEKTSLRDNILEKIYVTESSDLHSMILNTSARKYETLRARKIFDAYMPSYCTLDTPGRLPHPISEANGLVLMVSCDVDGSYIWSLELFRAMVNDMLKLTEIDVGLSLSCRGNGTVNLPWPMRANNLRYLEVQACYIVDHYTEAYEYNIDELPDTIESFRMKDCVIINDISYFEYQLKSNAFLLTRASICGPENAKLFAYVNITATFYGSKSLALKEFRNLGKLYTKNITIMAANTVSCQYRNLVVFDQSQTKNHGSTYFQDLIGHSYPVLKVLNFSNTELYNIPPSLRHWRLNFPKLKVLDLSNNHISDLIIFIDHDPYSSDKGVINLQYNNLTSVSDNQLKNFFEKHSSFYIDVQNNPFSCGCEMRDVKHFILNNTKTKPRNSSEYSYLRGLKCQNPKSVAGRELITLSDADIGCGSEIQVLQSGPIIILCVLVFVLFVCLVVIIRYRVEIKILAFTRFNIVFPCQQQDNLDNKKFDAFVAYSQQDSDWVLKNLVWQLETKLQNHDQRFHLCLHQRDFTVGAPIAENIINSIERSRHTILVISSNFVRSEWCLMEFRTAFHQSLIEKRRHMIIIVMGDLPHGELDTDIKRCLKTLTYLETHDRLFWDKLVYALSDKQRLRRRGRNHSRLALSHQSHYLSSPKY